MKLNTEDISSMDNIYESKYSEYVKIDEEDRATNKFNKAKNPSITNIIPKPANPSMFNQDYNDEISLLTGEKIDKENFKHNNMQPFIKGNITQNTNIENFTAKLDINTGTDRYYQNKKEVGSFFKPVTNLDNINGMQNYDKYYKEYIIPSKYNTNVLPFEKINVGPGLGKGYNSTGVGGFQQFETRDYDIPKTTQELHTKNYEKVSTFKNTYISPIKGADKRGIVSPYAKNKPETTYKQTADQWLITTNQNLKESNRPELNVKITNRNDTHTDYVGNVKEKIISKTEDDYGKNNILVYDNLKQLTQTKTAISNVTSIVKSIIAPIIDVLKYTTKEYTVESARLNGNAKTQIPEKATLYDPVNHIMKTTIKETTIHDSEMNNLTGPDKLYTTLFDTAKTTIKETLIHDTDLLNVKGNGKNYLQPTDKVKTTIKETLPVQENIRNMGYGVYKVYTYDPDMILKTTNKQTTLNNKSDLGYISGFINGLFGGYLSKEIDLKNTNKQYTSDYEEYGIAQSKDVYKQTSREAEYNAEIDTTREDQFIAAGHTPNPANMNIMIDKNDVNLTTHKEDDVNLSSRKYGNINRVVQTIPENIDECKITQNNIPMNAYKNRLDSSILDSLKNNEFNIKVNPIRNDCM